MDQIGEIIHYLVCFMCILQNKKMASTDGEGSDEGLSLTQSVADSKENSYTYSYDKYGYDDYQT